MSRIYDEDTERKRSEAKECFIVLRTYYKHAEMSYSWYYTEADLRKYLIEEIKEYYSDDPDPSMPMRTDEEMNAMDIKQLCLEATVHGNYRTVQEQIQWGIRAIISVPGAPTTITNDRIAEAARSKQEEAARDAKKRKRV